MLQLDQLALRRGAKLLFSDASARIHPGDKIGITGANGCGKSSLFQLILGELHADAGELQVPAGWTIAHVAQEMPATDRSALDFALDGDTELRRLEAEIERAEGSRLAELHGQLEHIGGYDAKARAARLLHGLGFKPGDELRPLNEFSGGWRMRLNLAQALLCRSDLLLLDEPTNHLDLDAVIWLEGWLREYPGTLLLISHDRDFLDAVATGILHIEQQGVALYPGNYTAFERIRAERLANQQSMHQRQQREIAHMRAYVDRFRAKATKARQAQSRLKALERMTLIAPAHVDSPFHFEFRPPGRLPTPLLKFEQADFGYGETPILEGIEFNLAPGDRVGLLGHNGAGKSTLVKTLAGELELVGGYREAARDLKIGYFAQHQLEQLRPDQTPLQHLLRLDPKCSEQQARNFLGGFGFIGDQALAPVAPFSGGEKSRLSLALIVYQRPNLLLLDEPTNHLDIEMREALAEALQGYEGALVLVSHDRHLLRASCDTLWLVHDGGVAEFEGSLDDYPRWLQNKPIAPRPEAASDTSATGETADQRKARKRAEAERRKQLQPLRNRVEELERRLERLQRKSGELDQQLADPGLYEAEAKDRLLGLLQEKARLQATHEETETAWLQATEQLEAQLADS